MFRGKKGFEPITVAIIIGVIILGAILVPPALSTTPKICDDEPYNYKCICNLGQVKQGFFPWECKNLPPAPSEVTFPIETWEEARAYTEFLLGGFECKGEYQYDSILEGEIRKMCDKYGSTITYNDGVNSNIYKGQIIMMECRNIEQVDVEGKPIRGHMVFSVRFDPNDGHVYEVSCNPDLITCPETTFKDNWKESPPPTCGDSCCHYGETLENCPSDCTVIENICGNGVCEDGESPLNRCFTDCYINYIPINYIENDARLLAFIYGWSGTLDGLDSKLKSACLNAINVPSNIESLSWFSDLTNQERVRFRCKTVIVRADGGHTYSSLFDEYINWAEKKAPQTATVTLFYGKTKLPI